MAAIEELGELPNRMATTLRSLQAAADVSFGCSEKDAVHHEDKLTLYHYRPIAPSANLPPVLIVYALVNRPYMMDLQPDRSLIRRLLELGVDVYLIDWGTPDRGDRHRDQAVVRGQAVEALVLDRAVVGDVAVDRVEIDVAGIDAVEHDAAVGRFGREIAVDVG